MCDAVLVLGEIEKVLPKLREKCHTRRRPDQGGHPVVVASGGNILLSATWGDSVRADESVRNSQRKTWHHRACISGNQCSRDRRIHALPIAPHTPSPARTHLPCTPRKRRVICAEFRGSQTPGGPRVTARTVRRWSSSDAARAAMRAEGRAARGSRQRSVEIGCKSRCPRPYDNRDCLDERLELVFGRKQLERTDSRRSIAAKKRGQRIRMRERHGGRSDGYIHWNKNAARGVQEDGHDGTYAEVLEPATEVERDPLGEVYNSVATACRGSRYDGPEGEAVYHSRARYHSDGAFIGRCCGNEVAVRSRCRIRKKRRAYTAETAFAVTSHDGSSIGEKPSAHVAVFSREFRHPGMPARFSLRKLQAAVPPAIVAAPGKRGQSEARISTPQTHEVVDTVFCTSDDRGGRFATIASESRKARAGRQAAELSLALVAGNGCERAKENRGEARGAGEAEGCHVTAPLKALVRCEDGERMASRGSAMTAVLWPSSCARRGGARGRRKEICIRHSGSRGADSPSFSQKCPVEGLAMALAWWARGQRTESEGLEMSYANGTNVLAFPKALSASRCGQKTLLDNEDENQGRNGPQGCPISSALALHRCVTPEMCHARSCEQKMLETMRSESARGRQKHFEMVRYQACEISARAYIVRGDKPMIMRSEKFTTEIVDTCAGVMWRFRPRGIPVDENPLTRSACDGLTLFRSATHSASILEHARMTAYMFGPAHSREDSQESSRQRRREDDLGKSCPNSGLVNDAGASQSWRKILRKRHLELKLWPRGETSGLEELKEREVAVQQAVPDISIEGEPPFWRKRRGPIRHTTIIEEESAELNGHGGHEPAKGAGG
ncbi:hypothetical protein C8R47DRAFT_1083142 [Mycena vitilis]|nr:hypothetical protein C8R47DRAFT_1083142 [Mycena vitilis]